MSETPKEDKGKENEKPKKDILKVKAPQIKSTLNEEILSWQSQSMFNDRTSRRIHCRFYIPQGKARKQVGQCKVPETVTSFRFKPRKIKGEPGEYYIRPELCDTEFKVLPKKYDKLVAEFWLNNPSQIDKSEFGRDVIVDAREIANTHHRFVAKNLLEQNVMIFVVMAMIGMIGMVIAIGYAMTKAPSERQIYTTGNGTQYIFQDGKLIAQGVNIHPIPQPSTAQQRN